MVIRLLLLFSAGPFAFGVGVTELDLFYEKC